MKSTIALSALAVIACASTSESTSAPPPGCNVDGLRELIGREGNVALNEEAMRRSGARQSRRIRPGDAVTMDYREDRLNIYVDARGRVERFECG
jgi:hypothetical protein